jgi:hypothetical protein
MNFIGAMSERPRYHANDSSLDVLNLEAHTVEIEDARARSVPPSLEREGFAILAHASVVRDFRDAQEVTRVHIPEIRDLLQRLSGADDVVVSGPGVLRFAERSAPRPLSQARRYAHYNVWRVLSPPPQDAPLAVCDIKDAPRWSFEGLVIRFNPAQRWSYFSAMTPREALVFKTCDSDAAQPHSVPRSSVEMRAIAYWWR